MWICTTSCSAILNLASRTARDVGRPVPHQVCRRSNRPDNNPAGDLLSRARSNLWLALLMRPVPKRGLSCTCERIWPIWMSSEISVPMSVSLIGITMTARCSVRSPANRRPPHSAEVTIRRTHQGQGLTSVSADGQLGDRWVATDGRFQHSPLGLRPTVPVAEYRYAVMRGRCRAVYSPDRSGRRPRRGGAGTRSTNDERTIWLRGDGPTTKRQPLAFPLLRIDEK